MRAGADEEEIVLGAEHPAMPFQLDRKLVLADAGLGNFEKAPVSELGDARRFARVRDLGIGFHGTRPVDRIVGRNRTGQ
jgi:hypothetical protein